MEETLRLEDLVQILKKKAAWIVLTTVAGIGLAAGVTFFLITPKYDSTAQLIAQNQEAEGSSGNLQNDIMRSKKNYRMSTNMSTVIAG